MGRFVVALVVGTAVFAAAAGACSNSSDNTVDPALADVIFEGSATPQALSAMLRAPVVADPTLSANFSWQSAGDELPVDPIPIFCWHIGSNTARVEPVQPSTVAPSTLAPSAAPWESRPKTAWTRVDRAANDLVRGLLAGVPEAHAAGVTNGLAYLLVFSTSHDPKLVRVFTTGTEYTPNQAAWDKITHAGELVTVKLTNANFDANRLSGGGGPFQGAPISFTFPVM